MRRRRNPLPPRPLRRPADSRTYLSLIVGLALGGLVVLPFLADGAMLAVGAHGTDGCRVLRVIDGDTVTLWCPGRGAERVRLTGYDAPEVFSPGCAAEAAQGLAATWALRSILLRGSVLALRDEGTDRYGRRLASLRVDGRPVAAAMIAGGHGRPYRGGARGGWCDP